MGLPRYVQVGGLRVSVERVDAIKSEAGPQECHGDYDDERARIRIDRRTATSRQHHSFLHELAHAAFDESGLSAELAEAMGVQAANELEERFVRVVTSGFAGALRSIGWLRFPGER